MPTDGGVYAITDCNNLSRNEIINKSEIILNEGIALFQYRDKKNITSDKIKLASELQSLCSKFNVPFIINDDLELAKIILPDGIHLGQHDQDIETIRNVLGNIIIGISCYNDIQLAITAKKSGADYIAFGSFNRSQTKPDAKIAKIDLISQAKSKVKLPIVAIGGITPENGKVLVDVGADYLAIISGLYSPIDTIRATKAYLNLFNK